MENINSFLINSVDKETGNATVTYYFTDGSTVVVDEKALPLEDINKTTQVLSDNQKSLQNRPPKEEEPQVIEDLIGIAIEVK